MKKNPVPIMPRISTKTSATIIRTLFDMIASFLHQDEIFFYIGV
jgi:hypothetical protein